MNALITGKNYPRPELTEHHTTIPPNLNYISTPPLSLRFQNIPNRLCPASDTGWGRQSQRRKRKGSGAEQLIGFLMYNTCNFYECVHNNINLGSFVSCSDPYLQYAAFIIQSFNKYFYASPQTLIIWIEISSKDDQNSRPSKKKKLQRVFFFFWTSELSNFSRNSLWSCVILNWWYKSKCFTQDTEEVQKMSFLSGFSRDRYIISAKHPNISHASYLQLITATQKHWKIKHFLCGKGNIFWVMWNPGTMFFKQLREGNELLSKKNF